MNDKRDMKSSVISKIIAMCIVLAGHIALVLRSYPFSMLLSGEPPIKGDLSRYFATAYGASQVDGLFGYDPHFMAGYPVGLWNSMGKKGFEVLNLMFPWVSLSQLFYISCVVFGVIAPLLIWISLRSYTRSSRASWILIIMSLLYWHFSAQISYFWGFGNMFYPAMSCVMVSLLVMAWRVMTVTRHVWWLSLLLALLAAMIFYFHTVLLVSAAAPLFVALFLARKHLRKWRTWVCLSASVALFSILAVWWFVPLMRNLDVCLSQPGQWFQAGPKHLIMDLFSDRAYRHAYDRNFLFHFVVVFGMAGAWLSRGSKQNSVLVVLASGGLYSLIIAYCFSYCSWLAPVQPLRFMIPATIMLIAPAAECVDRAIDVFNASWRAGKGIIVLLLIVLMPEFTGYFIDSTCSSVPPYALREDQQRVVENVKALNSRGRILCDDIRVGHMLPYYSGVSVIGGLSAQAFLKHRFAGVDDKGVIFGKNAGNMKSQEFKSYLDLYAVEYIIFSRDEWISFAERCDYLEPVLMATVRYRMFKYTGNISYIYEGAADSVSATYDQITVVGVASESVVLKYHYIEWMKANAGVELEPVYLMSDPVPFIKAVVPEGCGDFVIRKMPGKID